MNLIRSAVILAALGTSAFAAVDPQLLGLLPADAKAIAGVQVSQIKSSPFGQYLLNRVSGATGLDQLKQETGFDPRTDLTEIVASGNLVVPMVTDGASHPTPDALVVARGTFRASQLISVATAHGATTTVYRGVTLLQPDAQKSNDTDHLSPAIAFLDGSTLAAGPQPQVQAAVDRWLMGASTSSALAQKAISISAANQAWNVTDGLTQVLANVAVPAEAPAQATQQAAFVQNLLKMVVSTSTGAAFSADGLKVQGEAITKTAQDAQTLADVATFVIGLAANPQGQQNPLLSQLSFKAVGSAVQFSFAVNETQLETIASVHSPAPATVRNRRARQ